MHSRRLARLALAAAVASVALAGVASAHGGSVETPPVPVAAVLAGAAVAVGATALALAVGPDPPTGRVELAAVPASAVAWAVRGVRALVVVALAGAVASVAVGDARGAFAAAVLWPVLVKGTLLVAAVVGSPWRVVSPWAMAYDAVAAVEGRAVAPLTYPERAGAWPAVVGLVALVGVVENLTVVPEAGSLAVAALAGYALLAFCGALAFGREFLERADAFTVLYRLVGRVAPVAFDRDGDRVVVALRPPWTASARPLSDRGLAAFVVLALATVTFDGAAGTDVAATVERALTGVVGPLAGVGLYAVVALAFLLGAAVVARAVDAAAGAATATDGGESGATGRDRVGRQLAATLLPVAVAYDVAHNYAYVLVNATRAVELAGAAVGVPVGLDPAALLAPAVVWTTQVGLVLAGHVVAVVAAHLATTRAYPGRRRARRAHAPLAALMVAYTVASLYVLAA